MSRRWQICWPPVSDSKEIQITVWMGCIGAAFYALNWGATMLLGPIIYIFETHDFKTILTSLKAVLYFLIVASIGWGIYKKNRIATTAALSLALVAFIGSLASEDIKVRNVISALVSTFMFLHSTRGIFAYHKINKNRKINEQEKV